MSDYRAACLGDGAPARSGLEYLALSAVWERVSVTNNLPIVKDKYRSGNEGRRHPKMRHSGYFQGEQPTYVNKIRLKLQAAWLKAQKKK